MSKPTTTLDQFELTARCQALELSARYLSAALEARGHTVEAPQLSDNIFANVEALEKHCADLETKLAAMPVTSATDVTPESFAALRSERDQWKAKAEKFESEIAGLKTEIASASEKYNRQLVRKLVELGISHSGSSPLAGANAQGRKPTSTEKLLAARGADSVTQLAQTGNQKTTN